jgi:YggT family protein
MVDTMMDVLLIPTLHLVITVLHLYTWCLVVGAVLSWLVHFNVINSYSPVVRRVGEMLYQITEPFLRPVRRILPLTGGMDLSPVILILLVGFIQNVLNRLLVKIALGEAAAQTLTTSALCAA